MDPRSPSSLPRPCGRFLFHLHVGSRSFESRSLGELWFPRTRRARSVLETPHVTGLYPHLERLAQEALPDLFEGQAEVEIPRQPLLSELQALRASFGTSESWPSCFFFAPPVADGSAPRPLYSTRKMRTGSMIAGYDLCLINRNWDGTDRVEDLTRRADFTDAAGEIAIVQRSVEQVFGEDLEQAIALLQRTRSEGVEISWERMSEGEERLLLEVHQRAETWRQRRQIPEYHPRQIAALSRRWGELLQASSGRSKKLPASAIDEAQDLGAFWSEMMRGLWGGYYRPIEAGDAALRFGPKAEPTEPLGQPAVVLVLPFECEIQPIEKAIRALEQRKPLPWELQLEVFGAQKRQRALLLALGQELYHESPDRQHAALRLLIEIADGRVDRMLVEWLTFCASEDDLMRALERLTQSRFRVAPELLAALSRHEHDGVAARALWLLGQQKWPKLPEWIAQLLSGKSRIKLRPLARELLGSFGVAKQDKARAKKVLKSLGPIPPAQDPATLLPMAPEPLQVLPVLSEILEDCDSAQHRETALQILILYPHRDEEETLGAALADPDPELRCAVVALLAETDRPLALKMLKSRALFEQHGPCRTAIQKALQTWD